MRTALALGLLGLLLSGCGPTITMKHEVEAHITLDINLRLDKGLNDFFDFEEPTKEKAADPASPVKAEPSK